MIPPTIIAAEEEKMTVSSGVRKTGRIEAIPKEDWEILKVEANTLYEFRYDVPRKHSLFFWAWWVTFEPVNFTEKLRKEIAEKMEAKVEDIKVIWWNYDNETSPGVYAMQWAYIPATTEVAPVVALAITTLIALAIVCGTLILGMFKLSGEPQLRAILKITEEMAGWLDRLGPLFKYTFYIVLAGGSFWLAGKVIPKLGEKKAK